MYIVVLKTTNSMILVCLPGVCTYPLRPAPSPPSLGSFKITEYRLDGFGFVEFKVYRGLVEQA